MLYRLFAAGIVVFWMVMGTLLVRTELFPERSNSLPVPTEYVGHLFFRHEQPSDLLLYAQKRRIDGNFHVQPKRLPSSDGKAPAGNLLNITGNFMLTLPVAARQRVVFHGDLEMDDHEEIRRVDLSISLHEPKQNTPGVTLHLDGRPADNQWHFQVTQGTVTLREGNGTPEQILDTLALRSYGIDARVFSRVGSQSPATSVTAHRGVLRVNDEDIETFVVTIHQGDNVDTVIHVSPLGQILAVKTFLGYDLYDETLAP